MKRLSWLGLASAALISTGCASTLPSSGTSGTDFNGDWQLVTRSSDGARGYIDARNSLGTTDWETTRRNGDRVRYRAWFLPDDIRIEGNRSWMRIEDDRGTLIAEVPFEGDPS
jgi:hypothetical protein